MQNKAFITVVFIFILSISGWAQKKKPTQKSDIKYYQSLGASSKVANLMTQMTLDEKIGQLNLITPGGTVTGEIVSKDVESKIKNGNVGGIFGIRGAEKVRQAQEMAVKNSRLGIPLIVGMDVIHGHQTVFPIPLGLSCSWDMKLIEQSARIAAREATADGIMWTFSPMVDIARDPRWGRISEGNGEDPFLGSKIASAMVRGYQGNDLKDPTTMLACVKHFALYGAAEGGRDYGTVDMSKVRMFNEYLPPYKAAVDAGVGSVMTSFNVIDYVPASGSQFMFKNMKSNGFHMEDTHLQKDSRIETLIGLIALSYSWMLITGLMIKKKNPEIFICKAHGRPSKSVFKAGLEFIMRALYTNNSRDFARAIKFLSCT